MLAVASVMLVSVLVYAIGQPGAERNHGAFHPVYLVLSAGVMAAFLTGDLFNLFVAFEMMLTASYVLPTLRWSRTDPFGHDLCGHQPGGIRAVPHLAGADLCSDRHGQHGTACGAHGRASRWCAVGVRAAVAGGFGIKAALFPLFSWLPDSYPTAPSPITAVFAGLLTKVGCTPSSAPRRCSSIRVPGRAR